jgi:2-polyprenyl-6-methoxyphenol hydroxylase-like FAD-dependent oxidoreductase
VTVQGSPLLTGESMVAIGHYRLRVIAYPISRHHGLHGQAAINWVVEVQTAEGQPMPVQDWEYRATAESVLPQIADFVFDFIDVPALVRGAARIYQYPMVDRDPLPTWALGGVTLLGDAAHPMYPIGSNGASQAIVDARVLAREVATRPTVDVAIDAYDAVRRPATAEVVRANRKSASLRCQELVEERAPDGFRHIDDVIAPAELAAIMQSYRQVAGFSPDELNQRPSLSVR